MPAGVDWDRLGREAMAASQRAYAPYSGYRVGAALLAPDGEMISGCNVENASYGATLCAERVALGSALARGVRSFRALAVATPGFQLPVPCGICRQVLAEFLPAGDDLPVLLLNGQGQAHYTSLARLFPLPFRLGEQGD